MINTLAIAERELKSFFVSTVAWVIAAAFMAITGLLFAVLLLNSNDASLRFLFSNLSVIFLFVAPFLTMRLLAEEIRLGTVELLLTNPVRDVEVVLGKFLGVFGFVLVMLAMTLYYPALLYIFGAPDPGPMATGYLGVVLQAAAFLAIGLATSSTTENQIVAAFLAFAINLVLWLSESVSQFVGPPLGAALKFLSITSHFQDFSRGVIDTSHLIFFISVIAAALFLTYLSLQTRRWRA
ncbi:MAG TPA: ABC transporter permease [Chloroflexota bacterium]|nr:ABC transporter permease [Chloroflexota bacterium]